MRRADPEKRDAREPVRINQRRDMHPQAAHRAGRRLEKT